MKLVHGWAFPDADEYMASEIDEAGRYQARHLEAALGFVRDFSCAIDGGAHVGTWSRLLADRFDRVLAFEPSFDTYEALVLNMRAFACRTVEPHQSALGAQPGFVTMQIDPKQAARRNTGARFVAPGGSIPVTVIDSLNLPGLGFLKLDVEGSEFAALEGAQETLMAYEPVVLYENKGHWSQRYGADRQAPANFLKQLGYVKVGTVSKDEIWAVPR